ncbi:MAG: hypothetical protein VX278_09245, partial [Myxococcota bacterium]|nr:hypothetical protein [Myxococcota bacterium]
ELGQIEQEQQRAQKEKESAEQDWNRKQARQQHLQEKRDALQKEVEAYDQVIRQKTLEINVLSQQERQLLSLKKRMSEDIQKAEQNIKKKESEQSEHRTRQTEMKKEQIYIDDRIRALQLSIDEERKRLRKYQQSKNEKQTALSVIGERYASAEQNQKNISHSMERLKKRRAELTTEIQRLQDRLLELSTEVEVALKRKRFIDVECQNLREHVREQESRYEEKQLQQKELDAASSALYTAREKANQEYSRTEDALERNQAERDRLKNKAKEEHEIDMVSILEQCERNRLLTLEPRDTEEGNPFVLSFSQLSDSQRQLAWEKDLKRTDKTLAGMSNVNLAAIEQREKLSHEYAVMEKQRADVAASVATLTQFITELDQRCIQRFDTTFERVNKNFEELYPRLVGGGQAYLTLEHPEDLLHTGVRIFAQPPGKKLQVLNLLSGGEKAMVAIALLFSLFREKPSPFCLLDEVDAPLDEGNGVRFNMMLQEMATRSQFIVITHNKKTMEAMDILYGVSMPKPGVSQLGTARLE